MIKEKKKNLSGADTQNRTGDLTLTKGALYQLSHISIICLTMTCSHIANATLPSALIRFTSVFGMGTGGSGTLSSSGNPV